jgi:hypothetical protein
MEHPTNVAVVSDFLNPRSAEYNLDLNARFIRNYTDVRAHGWHK